MRKVFTGWLLPVLLALGLFLLVRPALAEFAERQSGSRTGDTPVVGVEEVDGHSRVYYETNGRKTFVSDPQQNSRLPHASGEYLVWVTDAGGAGQIYQSHWPTGQTIQLTHSSTNTNPRVSVRGDVVWQHWADDDWQVWLFDGSSTRALSSGATAINPTIDGDFVAYVTRHPSGAWKTVAFSRSQKRFVDVGVADNSQTPEITSGQIRLSPDSPPVSLITFFELDLGSLGQPDAPEVVTEGDIRAELEGLPLPDQGL